MAATDRIALLSVSVVPLAASPVAMAGDRLDVVEAPGIEVLPRLPLVAAVLDHVVEVRDHAGGLKGIPQVVEVDAPGIARALGKEFKLMPQRVVPPDGGIEPDAIVVGGARLADIGVGEHAVAAVEPAIGAPGERVEGFVGVVVSPAVQQDLWRAVGHVVAVGIGNEQEVRRRTDPHPTEANLQRTDEVEALAKHRPLVEGIVAVGVFEDQDPVAGFFGRHPHGIGVGLGHPQAATVVEGHRNRLPHLGLGGEQLHGEAWRHGHRLGGILGRQPIGHRPPPPRLRRRVDLSRDSLPRLDVHKPALLVADHDVEEAITRHVDGRHLHAHA